jgi:hypothetical protein
MDENEVRTLVREAIARQSRRDPEPAIVAGWREQVSHGRLPLARGGDGDGACLIEPAVRCNHCGYCLSFGH